MHFLYANAQGALIEEAIKLTKFCGFYSLNTVLSDHKTSFSCFTKNENISSLFYTTQTSLTKFQKRRLIYTKGRNLSVADLFSCSFTRKTCN